MVSDVYRLARFVGEEVKAIIIILTLAAVVTAALFFMSGHTALVVNPVKAIG